MNELFELKNCPIFSVGVWNGDSYAEADLDAMVQAYQQVGFKPPLKLGHDESQPLAKSDSMPALGWVGNLRRVGKVLYADFINLPRRIYDLIRNKAYNRVSAEVYWEYEEQGKKLPRVLKAVALLGAEIPAVTSLQALESLYAARGLRVKTYMDGMMPMPAMGGGAVAIASPGKAKADVNYREAAAGGYERCGACKFFTGPPSPNEDEIYLGGCALVEGEIASTFVCDLVEVRDAFTEAGDRQPIRRYGEADLSVKQTGSEHCVMQGGKPVKCFPTAIQAQDHMDEMMKGMAQNAPAKEYIIRKKGAEWCLMTHDGSKMLGCHPTEELAMAQERAVQASKHAGQDQIPIEYRYSVEDVEKFCPDCAKNMRFLNLKELKITYDPVTKTYAGFNEGLCTKFAPGQGFRTRCMDSSLGSNASDPGAMCNALEDWCFKSGFLASKTTQAQPAKTHGDGAQHGGSAMIDEEKKVFDGQQLAKLTADFEAFKADTAKTLAAKDTALVEKDTKLKEYEGQIATAEGERIKAEADRLRTENAAWIAQMSQAEALRLYPTEKPYVEHILAELSAPGLKLKEYTRTYTKDGKAVSETIPTVAAFKRLIELRQPNTMLFTELTEGKATDAAGQSGPPASMAAAREVATQRAKAYSAEQAKVGKKVPFTEAFRHVLDQDPELKSLVAGVRPEGQAKVAQEAAKFSKIVAPRATAG